MNLYLNCDDNPITFNKKNYLLRAAQRLGFDFVKGWGDFIPQEELDYVLNIEPYGKFAKGNRWSGVWEIDLLCDRPETGRDWHVADDVFVAVSTYASKLDNTIPKLLFQACDPDLHRKLDIPQTVDFVQCGSMISGWHDKRRDLVDALRTQFSFADMGNKYVPDQYVEKLNIARVQFIRSMSSPIADGEIAQRFFECLAIGPVLTNWVDDLKYTGLEEGKDFLAYRTKDEAIELMRILINNPVEREKIAQRGRYKAITQHSYEHRLISILNLLRTNYGFQY